MRYGYFRHIEKGKGYAGTDNEWFIYRSEDSTLYFYLIYLDIADPTSKENYEEVSSWLDKGKRISRRRFEKKLAPQVFHYTIPGNMEKYRISSQRVRILSNEGRHYLPKHFLNK